MIENNAKYQIEAKSLIYLNLLKKKKILLSTFKLKTLLKKKNMERF